MTNKKILQQINVLPRITPSKLSAEEQWRRNGEYISLHDVQNLFKSVESCKEGK